MGSATFGHWRVLVAAVVVVALAATSHVALADEVIVFDDSVDPVAIAELDFGEVCLSSVTTKPVALALERVGNGSVVWEDDVDVAVTVGTASPATNLSASGGGIIRTPGDWTSAATGTVTDQTATMDIVFTAPAAAGTFAGSVAYAGSGIREAGNNQTYTVSASLPVRAEVVACDTAPPTLSLPGPVTAEATGPGGAAVTFTPTATDENPPAPPVTCTPASGSTFALGTTTVDCSATDAAGNTAVGDFTVSVVDTTAPTLSTVEDVTVSAVDGDGATVAYTAPTASDLVSGATDVSCDPASGATFPLGSTTVECTATDDAGNTGQASFTVTVEDDEAPVLTLQGTTVEAIGQTGATATYVATADDAVDGPVDPECSPASGTVFPVGTTIVTCTATDAAGNTATGTLAVKVQDTTPPAVTVPGNQLLEAAGPDGTAYSFAATADDLVSGAVATSCSPGAGHVFPLGETTVTCTATDGAGNEGAATFSVTVRDTTAPMLNLPADALLEATSPAGAAHTFAATATDAVDGAIIPTCDAASGATFPLGTTTVECDVTDDAGNTAMGSFTIEVVDTTAPDLTVPGDITLEATAPSGASYDYDALVVVADIADTTPTVGCQPASGGTFALGSTDVTCTATDASGNTSTGTFTVTVEDTTPPQISDTPGNFDVEATGPGGAVVTYDAPTANDLVDGPVSVVCQPASGDTFAFGTVTVTCTATDAADNTAISTFDVTIADTTAPSLFLPSNVVEEATGPGGAAVTFAATAEDTVDGDVPVTCAPASGSTFALGTTAVDCSASDGAGNTATGDFVVTVVDTTPPVLTVPDDITAEATGPGGASVGFAVTAVDLVDGDVTPTCDWSGGDLFPLGDTVVTCLAVDARGNDTEASFQVTVEDTTAPVVTVPDAIVAEATGAGGAAVDFGASATDAVDGSPAVSCDPVPGSTFPLGANAVTCTSTDAAGNTGQATFVVTVQDTTAPDLDLPADITREATGPSGATVTFAAAAADLVDGTVEVTCTPASGSTFPIATTPVVCSTTDAAGNTAMGAFLITVEDTTGPAFDGTPSNFAVEATGPAGAVVTYDPPTATDLVDGSVDVTCIPPPGSTLSLDTHTIICSADDTRGNGSTIEFEVEVTDTTAPTLVVPADIVAEATGPGGATVTFSPSASDVVDGPITPTCNPPSGSTFPLAATPVACSASDAAGNVATGAFTVTVVDTTAPDLTVPADRTVEATGPSGAPVTYVASATDVVDGALVPDCAPASGSTFGLGATVVSCSVTDAAGNVATGAFTVTVVDTTAPDLTVPADRTVEATGPSGAPVTYVASATDVVDGALVPDCAPASGSTFGLGATVVSCSVTDAAGNVATGTFTVTVVDTTAPTVIPPDDVTTGPTNDLGAVVTYGTATAADLVSGDLPAHCTPPSGSQFGFGSTTVTCTATDAAGNTGEATLTVTVTPFTFDGFYAPIGKGRSNTVKGGSTVPFKWRLYGHGGQEFTSVGTVMAGYPKAVSADCASEAPDGEEEIADPATGGTSLRYDGKDGQFLYNWQTPRKPGACYVLQIRFQDGQTYGEFFRIR